MNNLNWQAIGPSSMLIGGIGNSGQVTSITISNNYDGLGNSTMFLGTVGGGIWRSKDFTNANPTWYPLIDNLLIENEKKIGILNVYSVNVDPINPSVIYGITDAGIIKTSNLGDDWFLLDNSKTVNSSWWEGKIIIDPRNNVNNFNPLSNACKILYAGGPSGLFQSINEGQDWMSKSVTGSKTEAITDIDYMLSGDLKTLTILAGINDNNNSNNNGIYFSNDDGSNWHSMNFSQLLDHESGAIANNFDIARITFGTDHNPGFSNGVYAAISKKNANWDHGILLNIFSLDNSNTWNPIGNDLPKGLDTQGGDNQPIAVSPYGTIYFAVSGNFSRAIFQSTNYGNHWEDISDGNNGITPHVDHHAWAFYHDKVFDGNDGGIWRFTPLTNKIAGRNLWESLNTPSLQTLLVDGISLYPNSYPPLVLAANWDNGTALWDGVNWKQVQGGDRGRVRYDHNPFTQAAYSTTYGWLDKSKDFGKTWSNITLDRTEFPDGMMYNYEIDPFGTGRVLIVGITSIYELDMNGNLNAIGVSLEKGTFNIAALAFTSDSNKIYAAFQNSKIYKTTNNGGDGSSGNWNEISNGTNWGGTITDLISDPINSETVFLSTDNGKVWCTPDGGLNWNELTGNLPVIKISKLQVSHPDFTIDPYLFAGMDICVYVCLNPNKDRSWYILGDGLPDAPVRDLDYNAIGRMLTAGTYGRGAFSINVRQLNSPSVEIVVPRFGISQSDCVVEGVEGQIITLKLKFNNLLNNYPPSYNWDINGATIPSGIIDQKTIKIQLPSPPNNVTVKLTVTLNEGVEIIDSKSFTPISKDVAEIQAKICHAINEARTIPIPFWEWDPEKKEIYYNPLSREQLVHLLQRFDQLLQKIRDVINFKIK